MPWKREIWINEKRITGQSKIRTTFAVLFFPALVTAITIAIITPQEIKLLGLLPLVLFFVALYFSGFFNPYNGIATVEIVEKDGKRTYLKDGEEYSSLEELLETVTWGKTA